ncbi:hypothetical protein ACO0OL_001418 [Hanseniaspora opuntiae]
MSLTTNNSIVLLKRTFSLKEQPALILVLDSLLQTASSSLLAEFKHNNPLLNVIYIGFENSVNKPHYADYIVKPYQFVTANDNESTFDIKYLRLLREIESKATINKQTLLIIDNALYVDSDDLLLLINRLSYKEGEPIPNRTVLTVYHKDNVDFEQFQSKNNFSQMTTLYPSADQILKTESNVILDLNPIIKDNKFVYDEEELDNNLNKFHIPRGFNNTKRYHVDFTNKRKSGRISTFKFIINSADHEYIDDTKMLTVDNPFGNNDISEFEGMTTFNLQMTDKQRKAKESVELPFMEAQQFSSGGAIVYEFEKDDDYDEEDPYEDPF